MILENKTICFNNLLNVDDLEEVETDDIGKFGKYVNVSCWTKEKKESIPLWNLYTPFMKGVRIGLPKYPFKKYKYKAGEYFFKEDVESFIELKSLAHNQFLLSSDVRYEKVLYTNDKKKLFPTIFECDDVNLFKKYVKSGDFSNQFVTARIDGTKVGIYKNKHWAFQREVRYIIYSDPMSFEEVADETINHIRLLTNRFFDVNSPAAYDRFFLAVDDMYFDSLEILIGPRANDADKVIVNALVYKYCPRASVRQSVLKIRK